MSYVSAHRDQFGVEPILRVLDIEPSTYYGWVAQTSEPCNRAEEDLGLASNIYEIWTASGCTYGADRVHQQLRRDGHPHRP